MYPDYYGYAGYMPSSGEAANVLLTFLVIYLVVLLLALAYSVLVYVLHSLGAYTIAKRRGIHHPWLSWIPVANVWILGSVSDQYQYVAKGRVRNRRKVLLGLTIATYALMIPFYICYFVFLFSTMDSMASDYGNVAEVMIPALIMLGIALVMMVVAIVLTVFQYIAYYDLFASCNPDNAVMFLVLGIFFSFTLPFFVFACRKKDLGMPPRKSQIPAPTWQPAPPPPQPVWQQPAESAAPVEPEVTLSEPADEAEE